MIHPCTALGKYQNSGGCWLEIMFGSENLFILCVPVLFATLKRRFEMSTTKDAKENDGERKMVRKRTVSAPLSNLQAFDENVPPPGVPENLEIKAEKVTKQGQFLPSGHNQEAKLCQGLYRRGPS